VVASDYAYSKAFDFDGLSITLDKVVGQPHHYIHVNGVRMYMVYGNFSHCEGWGPSASQRKNHDVNYHVVSSGANTYMQPIKKTTSGEMILENHECSDQYPLESGPPGPGEPTPTPTPVDGGASAAELYPVHWDAQQCDFGVKVENGKFHIRGIPSEDFDPVGRFGYSNPTLSWEEAPTLIIDNKGSWVDIPTDGSWYDPMICTDIDFVINQDATTNVGNKWSDSGHELAFSTTPDGTHAGGVEYDFWIAAAVWYGPYRTTTAFFAELTEDTLYYYCKNHPGMGGKIKLISGSVDPTPTPTPTQSVDTCMCATQLVDGSDIKLSWDLQYVVDSIDLSLIGDLSQIKWEIQWGYPANPSWGYAEWEPLALLSIEECSYEQSGFEPVEMHYRIRIVDENGLTFKMDGSRVDQPDYWLCEYYHTPGEPVCDHMCNEGLYPAGVDQPICGFNVKVENGKFHVQGVSSEDFDLETRFNGIEVLSWKESPTLMIDRTTVNAQGWDWGCSTIEFQLDEDWYPSGHVLAFSTTPDGTHGGGERYAFQEWEHWVSGVYTEFDLADPSGVTPEGPHPLTLYYYCENHPGMGGKVILS